MTLPPAPLTPSHDVATSRHPPPPTRTVLAPSIRLRPADGGTLHVLSSTADAPPAAVAMGGLRLYMLMGREVVSITEAAAGTVCGIGGLGGVVSKCATLSTDPKCPPFAPMGLQGAPIVQARPSPTAALAAEIPYRSVTFLIWQVALEPLDVSELPKLATALGRLSRSDPAVEVASLPTGEHILRACGEARRPPTPRHRVSCTRARGSTPICTVMSTIIRPQVHLERCIYDLRKTYAIGVDFSVSSPIVPFRESVEAQPQQQ